MLETETTGILDDMDLDQEEHDTIAQLIENAEIDFRIGEYRFIHQDEIDSIQQEELSSDTYILGCFNADFITDNTNLGYEIVKALQQGEQFIALGKFIVNNGYLEGIQAEYARLDGYGNHFASYDHKTLEYQEYYVFRLS